LDDLGKIVETLQANQSNRQKWRVSASGVPKKQHSADLSALRKTSPAAALLLDTSLENKPTRSNSADIRMKYATLDSSLSHSDPTISKSEDGKKTPEGDKPKKDKDEKQRSWKKASVKASLDTAKELEEEKKLRVSLEDWKSTHEGDVSVLKKELNKMTMKWEKAKQRNQDLKKELQEVKEKLVNATMELMQLKENQEAAASPSASPLSSPGSKGGDSPSGSAPVRSWNKKIIHDMQDVGRQLNNEKKARRELEQWKVEAEEKMEDMKKRMRQEVDSRVKLEEAYRKLEREVAKLKNSTM
jgi:chromosome segregation ATPase